MFFVVFFHECWNILLELAPWLLLGMLLAGIMEVFLPKGFVKRKLRGPVGVIRAVLLGVPMPLCSCGVIPAGIGLKKQGASHGAAVAFLISTPQTGVDSILVASSFFGWPFAIFKMASAAITGIVGGWLTDAIAQDEPETEPKTEKTTTGTARPDERPIPWKDRLPRIVTHGIDILRSIWVWLVIGILVSAAINTWVPSSWYDVVGSWGLFTSMLLVLALSIPIYVCATASVPIAAALVHGGFPPAAALVFLIAGPATNVTTIGAIASQFGKRTLGIYLITIVIGSMAFAWLFDWLLDADMIASPSQAPHHQTVWAIASAILLLLLIGYFGWEKLQKRFRRSGDSSTSPSAIRVGIEGMSCGNCVGRLEKGLLKHEQIESAQVTLQPPVATVTGTITRQELEEAIERLGFRVVPPNDLHTLQ